MPITVVALKLNKSLAVSSCFDMYSTLLPLAKDKVTFWFELFEQCQSPFLKGFFVVCLPIGEEHGAHRIDDNEITTGG